MSYDVVVLGDANVDLVLRGDVVPRFGQTEQLLDAADLTLGGSGAIVAAGLARLGHEVAIIAAVGTDVFGDFVVEQLRERGVATEGLVRRPELSTGISVILSADDRAILTHTAAISSLAAVDVDESLLMSARHVHSASRYLLPALAPDLPRILAAVRAAGAAVSIDTNDDPSRTWEGVDALLANVDVALPNRDELCRWAEASGHDVGADWVAAGKALAAAGPEIVVKLGADGGARFGPDGDVLTQQVLPAEPVDTTGAGDSFDAAWISARLAGADDRTALRWAVAGGSLSTRAAGSIPAQGDLHEVRALAASLP